MATQPNSDCTRASLLSRANRRDSRAWNDLVQLYGPLIAHWCRRCGLDYQQAADGVQEVFATLVRSLDTFQPNRESGAFRAWLWTSMRSARYQASQTPNQQRIVNFHS